MVSSTRIPLIIQEDTQHGPYNFTHTHTHCVCVPTMCVCVCGVCHVFVRVCVVEMLIFSFFLSLFPSKIRKDILRLNRNDPLWRHFPLTWEPHSQPECHDRSTLRETPECVWLVDVHSPDKKSGLEFWTDSERDRERVLSHPYTTRPHDQVSHVLAVTHTDPWNTSHNMICSPLYSLFVVRPDRLYVHNTLMTHVTIYSSLFSQHDLLDSILHMSSLLETHNTCAEPRPFLSKELFIMNRESES